MGAALMLLRAGTSRGPSCIVLRAGAGRQGHRDEDKQGEARLMCGQIHAISMSRVGGVMDYWIGVVNTFGAVATVA